MTLLGRRAECEALDGVLADALAARSRVVVRAAEDLIAKQSVV